MDDQVLSTSESLASFKDQILLVDNTLTALQDLAKHHRRTLNLPLLALTGSNGKTTTKELLHAALSKRYRCMATLGNLNNHIGVPLTLLRMNHTTEIGIVEMGANHQKEIEFLCLIAEPNFGYITNYGKAHLEGFGGMEGVIKGKSELIDYLQTTNGHMFVQSTDAEQIKRTTTLQRTVLNAEQQWQVTDQDSASQKSKQNTLSQQTLSVSGPQGTLQTQLIGAYNTTNIIAAAEIAAYFEVSWGDVKSALTNYIPQMNRSQRLRRGSYELIMDAYNANPSSIEAALSHFAQTRTNETKTVILGDMFELGQHAQSEHQLIVERAQALGFDRIYLSGSNFSKTSHDPDQSSCFLDYNALEEHLLTDPPPRGTILIKGSRGMALERLLYTVFKTESSASN
jgi:UDP-N-acetylmuramoyl-tripeptide--D-alanyl-D-alanine ligase